MSPDKQLLVSVVIAVYNGERFVARAIDSVRRQTYGEIELIVVDDGSIDATYEVARDAAPHRLVRLPDNSGVSTARNIGTSLAAGDFITYLDADDEMLPEKVALQVARLAAEPPCDGVLTHQRILIDDDAEPPRWLAMDLEQLDRTSKLPISLLTRMGALLRAGGFDPSFRTSEEMDVLMRLVRTGAALDALPDVAVHRHIHGRNATYDYEQMNRDLLRAVAPLTRASQSGRVSVIIPVRDGAAYLGEALRSVRAQEEIEPGEVEVIVVDDGSTDRSAVVAAEVDPAARIVRQPPLGPGAARNHGMLLSRGAAIAFLDADDVWPARRLRVLLEVCESGVDAVFGAAEEFLTPDATPEQRDSLRPRAVPLARMPTAMLISRDAFARVGMFSTDPTQPDAVLWYAAALDAGITMAAVPDVVLHRRLHGANHSLRESMATASYPAALKSILDRRRDKPA